MFFFLSHQQPKVTQQRHKGAFFLISEWISTSTTEFPSLYLAHISPFVCAFMRSHPIKQAVMHHRGLPRSQSQTSSWLLISSSISTTKRWRGTLRVHLEFEECFPLTGTHVAVPLSLSSDGTLDLWVFHYYFICPEACGGLTISRPFTVIDIGFAFNLFHYTDHEILNVPILIDLDFSNTELQCDEKN